MTTGLAPISGSVIRFISTLALATVVAACDPGYRYGPVDWQVINEGALWSTSFDDVALTHRGIGGLIGSEYIVPQFDIRNGSNRSLVLERAELVTAAGRQPGELPGAGAIEARTINAGATASIPILWNLPQPAINALGMRPIIVLEFRHGQESRSLTIRYERVS